jgi:hypothetical protein
MIYLTIASDYPNHPRTSPPTTGIMDSPAQSAHIPPATPWAIDSGCYSTGYPGDIPYLRYLATRPHPIRKNVMFATAPDHPTDHVPALQRSTPFFPIIRNLGYPVAFVIQNGATPQNIPWPDFDVVFIGGTTDWKLGPEAQLIAHVAIHEYHYPVHMGRVNSQTRYRYATQIGCTSADGTTAVYSQSPPPIKTWADPAAPIECEVCHRPFYTPRPSTRRTCSPACRQRLHRMRHNPESAPPPPPPQYPPHPLPADLDDPDPDPDETGPEEFPR